MRKYRLSIVPPGEDPRRSMGIQKYYKTLSRAKAAQTKCRKDGFWTDLGEIIKQEEGFDRVKTLDQDPEKKNGKNNTSGTAWNADGRIFQ